MSHAQLVELYGEDARVFLLKSLVDGIDFRDTKGTHKDALKIQILVHEISQTITQSNFASVVCVALGLGSGKKGKEHSKSKTISTIQIHRVQKMVAASSIFLTTRMRIAHACLKREFNIRLHSLLLACSCLIIHEAQTQ